ncbi:IQ domain-containing protein G [Bagarius yarrelli]|uniref:Dynein regulatory complex protein 9 n=1 Tax=Bagarius yarrelli TaxID=175774 RepID=A0A556V8I9_BAGYA|nr:IQ domain-containing protein G [Bagarius yarrelli]
MSVPLSAAAVLRVCAVFRDCVDQLAVLGNILSGSQTDTTAAQCRVSEDISAALQQNRAAEVHLKEARRGQTEGSSVTEAVQELHRTQQELENMLKETTASSEYINKVQRDRKFAALLIGDALTELKEGATFSSLIHTVEEEKRTEEQMQEMIQSFLNEKRVKFELNVNRCLQERDKMAAYLEDQLQEWKLKRNVEEEYVNNSAQLLVDQGQKLNRHMERLLEAEIQASTLKMMMSEEKKAHQQLEAFLKNNQNILEEKLDYWMERYDNDTEEKQRELNIVKTDKSNNLMHLEELANKYKECEQVIMEDRLEKEKLLQQLEKEHLYSQAAIKVQSWWRGMLVRKGLGPFKKQKKSKQKKESKKGKK